MNEPAPEPSAPQSSPVPKSDEPATEHRRQPQESTVDSQGSPGSTPSAPSGPRDLRVSDAEREHVVEMLQKAIGRGLLDLDEFTTRTDTALAARTRGELNSVLVDLPGLVNSAAPLAPTPSWVRAGDTEDRREIRGKMSSIHRSGRWAVPRELVVRNSLGSTKLDFTNAAIAHDRVHIELDVKMGSVKLRLPPEASVNTDHLEIIGGSMHGGSSAETPGRPHFVITGHLHMGSLKISRRGGWAWNWPGPHAHHGHAYHSHC